MNKKAINIFKKFSNLKNIIDKNGNNIDRLRQIKSMIPMNNIMINN